MNEFQEKDYGQARSYADQIKTNADNIMGIFDDINDVMNNLYGSNWESCGADNARARYEEIRKNYEVFYNNVIEMHSHIHNVTTANESADKAASQTVSNV